MKKRLMFSISALVMLLFLGIVCAGRTEVSAASASPVAITAIDYDKLTMTICKNGNGIVFYSTDQRSTWKEVEGIVSTKGGQNYIEMDISWVSATSDVQIYFKGNIDSTAISVTLPKANASFKVKYDKVNVDFTFVGNDGCPSFMWRKTTDYNWVTVPFDITSQGYKDFIRTVDDLRFKGTKIIIRTGQVAGTSADNPGERPSKDVTVVIAKMAAAPNLKVNVKKMNVNTKTNMEYYDEAEGKWIGCQKNMMVEQIAPDAMYDMGAENVAIRVRVAATDKKPHSQTALLSITGQPGAPSVVGSAADVTYEFTSDGKFLVHFPKVTKAAPIDYCIVKDDAEFVFEKAKWKTVKVNTKVIKLTEKSAPSGTTLYFRFTGTAANPTKKIELKLASDYVDFSIDWKNSSTKINPKPIKKTN